MNEIRLKAFAKINLGLDVLKKREDGYHELKMVMQTINLYDRITIRKIKKPGIAVRTNLPYLPKDQHNLAYKAAELLKEEFGIREGISVSLHKYIPVAAGLAGGSSNAAAVLFGVNRLFGLGLSLEDLKKRGVKIGADVPYCLMRGTALAEGIGDKLLRLPPAPQCYVVLAKPSVSVSTKYVYENLHVDQLSSHPDIDGMAAAIREENLAGMVNRMGNVLETVTEQSYPVIGKIKAFLMEEGALGALMSGSGPTVFGLFDDYETAQNAFEKMKRARLARQTYLTTFFHIRRPSRGGN